MALGGGKGVKPLGQVLGIGQQAALPAHPVVGKHRVQKIQPCAVVEQHQVKGPILGPAHIVPKADAGVGQPGAADAVFPHRPVPGPVQAFQAGGVVIAVKGAGQQAQAGVFGQGAVGLPLQMLTDEPVEIRVSGQFAAQRLQQAGGHGIVAVQEQHPLAFCGGQPGVAGVSQAAVLLVEHPQAGDLCRQHVADLAAGIGGAVIHEDALPIPGTGLLRHAFDARRQVVLHIINRHDDGKLGHGFSLLRCTWEIGRTAAGAYRMLPYADALRFVGADSISARGRAMLAPTMKSAANPADTARFFWCGRTIFRGPAPVCPMPWPDTVPTSCRWSC